MLTSRLLVATLLLLGLPSTAQAIVLTNRDMAPHIVTVMEDDETSTLKLQPAETIRDICLSGCVLFLEDDESSDFEGNELVSIEEGEFVIEE